MFYLTECLTKFRDTFTELAYIGLVCGIALGQFLVQRGLATLEESFHVFNLLMERHVVKMSETVIVFLLLADNGNIVFFLSGRMIRSCGSRRLLIVDYCRLLFYRQFLRICRSIWPRAVTRKEAFENDHGKDCCNNYHENLAEGP